MNIKMPQYQTAITPIKSQKSKCSTKKRRTLREDIWNDRTMGLQERMTLAVTRLVTNQSVDKCQAAVEE